MTTEEILLTVLTVAIVTLILTTLAVLFVLFQAVRKLKQATTEIQELAERGTLAAARMAPLSVGLISVLQVAKLLMKKRN